MPHFESYITNGQYYVGCTGQTVYVYDSDGNEKARFKDIKYAYLPLFNPRKDVFAVKSTTGWLAIYSTEEMKLIKKFRFSKVDGSQDDTFCFSPDGKYLFNIERYPDSTRTRLSVYDTADFVCVKHILNDDHLLNLDHIEYDESEKTFFVLGFIRDKVTGVAKTGFIAKLYDDKLEDFVYITMRRYTSLKLYKLSELSGYYSNDSKIIKMLYKDLKQDLTEKITLSDIHANIKNKKTD